MIEGIDVQEYIDWTLAMGYKIFKIPFNYWNMLPDWVHLAGYAFVLLVAISFAWITWHYRDAWRSTYH